MLISCDFLNEEALTSYIAAAEGGLRESGTTRARGSRGFGGSIGNSAAKVEARAEKETENTLNIRDHQASRLQRLIAMGHADPEGIGWYEIINPDDQFGDIGTGALIEWECDVYMPEAIAAVSNHSGLSNMIDTMKSLAPAAEALSLDMGGMPNVREMDAMAAMLSKLDIAPVVIGEDSETEWRVVGSLAKEWIAPSGSFDDRARIVGKVKKRVAADRWYPMLSLPGMNLVSRDDRRRLEREGPKDASEAEQFVQGPLVVVDYLAIFS